MAGKHRGPTLKGKSAVVTRYVLRKDIADALTAMATREIRSISNMISVLLTEAIEARLAKK